MKSITSSQVFLSLLALVVLGPFCVLFYQSFSLTPTDLETWDFTFKQLGPLSLNSFLLVLTTVFFSSIMGGGMALILVLTDIPGRKYLKIMSLLPLALPLYVLAFVYLGIFEYAGVLHTSLRSIGIDIHSYLPIKSFLGVGIVFSFGLFPYVYLTTSNSLCRIGYDQVKAAMSLGKSRIEILRFIIAPHLKAALASGIVIVSLETFADFGGASAFNYDTFTTSIYNAWASLYSFGVAARLSLILLGIALVFMWWERKIVTRTCMSRKCLGAVDPMFKLTGRNKFFFSAFCWGILTFALFIPLLTLLVWSIRAFDVEWGSHYLSLVGNSFGLSVAAAVVLLVCGLFLNLFRRSGLANWQRPLMAMTLTGYAIPGNVIAVAVFIFFALVIRMLGWEMGVYLALFNLVVGYLIRFLSVAFRNYDAPLKLVPKELDKASLSLGLGGVKMWLKLHFPILFPASGGIFILLFLEVFKEMPLTLMLRPTGHDTLAVKIFELTSEGEWERAAIAGSCLVLIALAITILFRKRFEVAGNA